MSYITPRNYSEINLVISGLISHLNAENIKDHNEPLFGRADNTYLILRSRCFKIWCPEQIMEDLLPDIHHSNDDRNSITLALYTLTGGNNPNCIFRVVLQPSLNL